MAQTNKPLGIISGIAAKPGNVVLAGRPALVRDQAAGSPARIYADRAGTRRISDRGALITDAKGAYSFYVPQGASYSVTVYETDGTIAYVDSDLQGDNAKDNSPQTSVLSSAQVASLQGSAVNLPDDAAIYVLGGHAVPNVNKVVDGDWTAAIQEAANRPEPLLIPKYADANGSPYAIRISSPILISQAGKQVIIEGEVQAASNFSGASNTGSAMFWSNNVAGGRRGVRFYGGGTLNANGYADRGIYLKYVIASKVSDLNIYGARLVPVHVGAADAGATSYEVTVSDLDIKNVGSGTNDANSIGVYYEAVSDSTIRDTIILGYRKGVMNAGASVVHDNVHPWTYVDQGPMLAGFHNTGDSALFTNCYADTPTSLGALGGADVYGYLLEGFRPRMIGCRSFLYHQDSQSRDVSRDNEAYGVYINRADGGELYMFAYSSTSNNAGKRYKDVLGGVNLTNVLKTATILGTHNDGRSVTFSAGDRMKNSTTTNMKWTGRGLSRGDNAATLASDSSRLQLWDTPITAERVVTLPSTELYDGLSFRIIRGYGCTGAFNLVVKTAAGTTLKTLTVAGQSADFTVFDDLQWRLVGSYTL